MSFVLIHNTSTYTFVILIYGHIKNQNNNLLNEFTSRDNGVYGAHRPPLCLRGRNLGLASLRLTAALADQFGRSHFLDSLGKTNITL